MRKLFCVLLVLSTMRIHAQGPDLGPGTLPNIIPPSPDVASLVRAGSMSTGLHTGSANVNIPLYELVVGSIKLPIGLNYSTNGTKVNDIASRVGLGWNLTAGGSVSRTVHDEEDGGAQTVQLTTPDFYNPSSALMTWLSAALITHNDTEKDEYAFSVNGASGKFFLDDNGNARIADHSNVKILKEGNSFSIYTSDGIKYEFGKNLAIEKTRDAKVNGSNTPNNVKTTAWFLSKIVSPEGDEVYFHYDPIYTKTKLGPYQSVISKILTPADYPWAGPLDPPEIESVCTSQWSEVGYSKVDYDTWYLSRINASNGLSVYFVYADRPDASLDNRLVSVNVFSSNGADQPRAIRKYTLQYEDYTVGSDLNQRFYLKKVIQTTNESTPQTITHEFQYNYPNELPSQDSKVQDYYGYHGGISGSYDNFFPKPIDWENWEYGVFGSNRGPVFSKTMAGTLKKVIYPTGGYEEFVYEPHTLAQTTENTSYAATLNMQQIGDNQTDYCQMLTYTQSLQVTAPQAKITYTTEWNTSGPNPLFSEGGCEPDSIHFLSYLEIWDLSTNTRVFEARHKWLYITEIFTINLEPGAPYEVRLKVKGKSTRSIVAIQYNPTYSTTYSNVDVCGLRVKKIRAYDPLSNTFNDKFYKYASLQYPDRSSGMGVVRPNFEGVYKGGAVVAHNNSEYIMQCPDGLMQMSSSNLSGHFTFNGSPIAYTHVIESDDENLTNGGIEHRYYTVLKNNPPLPIIGIAIPGSNPPVAVPDMNGTEMETKVFKKVSGNIVVLKKTTNIYTQDTRLGWSHTNYSVRKRWNPPVSSGWTWPMKLKGYDVNSYSYHSRWWYLYSTTTEEFDQNGLNPKTTTVLNTYDNTAHLQPTQISTTNSKGETLLKTLKYPGDISNSVHTAMINKNITSTVIESSNTNNSNPINKVYNTYIGLGSGGNSFFRPQTVSSYTQGVGPDIRLENHSFDASGNPQEISKKNDVRITYLWNYLKTYPVAEIKNAILNDVAYTSFEADDLGLWSHSGTKYSGGVTGVKYFTGTLTRTGFNTSKSYIVTAWVKTSATVNNTSGTLLLTKGSWKLYQWQITGSSTGGTMTVSGTEIDEVRMHPSDATMSTYTYFPFIGISSICDINNKIIYHEYDGFARLRLVLDIDKNVIKRICYNYAGQTENCTAGTTGCENTQPNWQSLQVFRCQVDETGQNTGYKEQQQLDQNACSPSYNQNQWVVIGYEQSCAPPATVTISSINYMGSSGYTAAYTNTSTSVVTVFNIPSTSGTQTLGTLPEGTYNLTISKSGGSMFLLFGSGCAYQSGTSATFTNVNVTPTTCKTVTIENDL